MAGMNGRPGVHAAHPQVSGPRPPVALYVAGPFSMGYVDFFTFVIPLYGLSLGLDAAEIGILVGARSILALVLSIHIGVLMDRFGTRAVTLVFVWIGMALAPLFPLAPSFWALLVLQLISGAAVSFAWSGAQTLSPSWPRAMPSISAGSASLPGSARPRRRLWRGPCGTSAALGRPICSAVPGVPS